MDPRAEVEFEVWRDLFVGALGGAATAPSLEMSADTLIRKADELATKAAALIRERAQAAHAK